MKRLLTALIVSVLWPTASGAFAQPGTDAQLILIDGSGSMAGFFKTGAIQELHSLLQGQSRATSRYFVNEDLVETQPARFGAHTYLSAALRSGINERTSIIWMVTDNQPSVSTHRTESD